MKRILVMSDSHGYNDNVRKAVEKAGKIDYAIHLGDIGADYRMVESITGVMTYMVAGNNDFGGYLRNMSVISFGSHKCLLTHGHRQAVSFGLDNLRYLALENECDIAMYGHTHVPLIDEGDVTIINPGSLTFPRQAGRKRTFIIMEIDDEEKVTFSLHEI